MNTIEPVKAYHKGDIVWAKVRGHPWWPAKFVDFDERDGSDEPIAIVNFIGDQSHAYLPMSKVVPYTENRLEFAKTKRKDLTEAVNAADILVAKGPRIHLSENYAAWAESPIHEAKKRPIPDKRVIIESEEESEGTPLFEHSASSGSGAKIATVEDAKNLLAQLAIAKDVELCYNQRNSVKECIKAINENVVEHGVIMKTGIGAFLKRFTIIYGRNHRLQNVVEYAKNCLAKLEKIVLEAYFGGPLEAEEELEEPQQHKRKKLKHTGEEAPEEKKTNTKPKAENKENESAAQVKIEPDDSPAGKPQEILTVPAEPEPVVSETEPAKDSALMISVCQEIAKLIEEVGFAHLFCAWIEAEWQTYKKYRKPR